MACPRGWLLCSWPKGLGMGLLGALLALASESCGEFGGADESSGGVAPDQATPAAPVRATLPPLIVITLDTTRADHLSCYGYPVDTTPALDRRAATAVRFERAYAPMGQTLPSHASLFTGQAPRQHGLTDNHRVLPERSITLAERLGAAGYDTAAFVSSAVLHSESGIAQGFEYFDESRFDGSNARHLERDARAVTDAALSWLPLRDKNRPLFLWVHYFDPHQPFEAPEEILGVLDIDPIVALLAEQAALVDESVSLTEGPRPVPELRLDSDSAALYWWAYDAEIRYTDHHLARLFEGLRAAGLSDEAIVLVVGDHGEGLYQHGERGHGVNLFEELMRVPLLLWTPDAELAGEVIPEPIALADIHDVLLQLCLGEEAELPEATLWDELLGHGKPRQAPIFLERPHFSQKHLRERGGKNAPQRYVHGEMVGVIAAELKFIVDATGREQLFDLGHDPQELINLAPQRPRDVKRLRGLLDDWKAEHPLDGAKLQPSELSDERRAALLQLGYGG